MTNRLVLSGGLGNQIFQYVAANQIFSGENFCIDYESLSPNTDANGIPDLQSLKLSTNVHWVKSEFSKTQRRILGLLLHFSSITPDSNLRRRFLRKLRPLITFLTEAVFFRGFNLAISDGIGSCEINLRGGDNLLIGNFHSFVWFDRDQIANRMALDLRQNSAGLQHYREELELFSPLVVHIRLGDFTSLTELNITTKKYFVDGISRAWATKKYKIIWVFSNDIEVARSYLPGSLMKFVKFMDNSDFSPAQTLELMKYGAGYVISNSTFGWWAATLSKVDGADTFVPASWYRSIAEPADLIRREWVRVEML